MLKKDLRLTKNKEFTYIYRKGYKIKGRYFIIYAIRGNKEMKIGFSLSKKVGNAVIRNLYKRRLHEIFGEFLPVMKVNKYVVVASPSINEANYQELREDIITTLEKSDFIVLKEGNSEYNRYTN
ncbi:MAG: ribonuclease P protein component [Firmicutes bacterium]|nr:ribonuclease P protein component [Bacillota bacterium]